MRGSVLLPLVLLLTSWGPAAAGSAAPSLTAEERAWLAQHGPVVVAMDDSFAPFVMENAAGEASGISVDLARLITVRLGVEFRFQSLPSLEATLDALRNGSVDVSGVVATSPEREAFLDFTEPFAYAPTAIWARSRSLPLPEDLAGVRVASVHRGVTGPAVLAAYPQVTLVGVEDLPRGLDALLAGDVDAFVAPVPSLAYLMARRGVEDVVPARPSLEERALAWAVPEGDETLRGILAKGMASISEEERRAIFLKWTGTDLGPQREPSPMALHPAVKVGGGVLAGAALLLGANVLVLRRQVTARTRELHEKTRLLAAVVEGAGDAIFAKDAAGRYVLLNPSAARLLGRPREEVLGRRDLELLAPEVARVWMRGDREVTERAEPHVREEAVGGRRLLVRKSPLVGDDGEVVGIIGVALELPAS